MVIIASNLIVHVAYFTAWAFFAYGPQLVICLVFAWSSCRRTHGDLLAWMTRGFLWSLLPFVGVIAMWWTWRRASCEAAATGAAP